METNLLFDKTTNWKHYKNADFELWIKGIPKNKKINDIITELFSLNKIDLILEHIKTFKGIYSFTYKDEKKTIIVSDRIRSTPVYYKCSKHMSFISNNYRKLISEDKLADNIRDDAVLEIKMGGFTIGDKTIINDIYSTLAGQCVVFLNNKVKKSFYFKYFTTIDSSSNNKNLIEELSEITKKTFQNTLNKIGDRQILIPLSAGNDSRLVASLFKELGAKNVLCFSYGRKGNFEARFAKQIAEKLNYKWIFLPNIYFEERKFYKSKIFSEYLDFSDSLTSVPYFQGLSTNYRLKKMKIIEKDAVFINGNSGDFISGGHIYGLNNLDPYNNLNLDNLIDIYLEKHFSLWGNLGSNINIDLLKLSILNLLNSIEEKINKDNFHLCYEFMELIDRQSKYVVSGQLTYEFFNYDWELPLWADEYLFFWRKVPREFKINQSLYIQMLKKLNWGGVWNDIPVNKLHISPKYIIPLRFLAKIPFGMFGKKGVKSWHDFETVFFKYFTDPTNYFTFKSYFDVIKTYSRKPKNAVSLVVDDYLNSKKIN